MCILLGSSPSISIVSGNSQINVLNDWLVIWLVSANIAYNYLYRILSIS